MKISYLNSILCAVASMSLLLSGAVSVRADLLVYEGFDYPVTSNAGNGSILTNGYGWAEGSYWPLPNAKDTLLVESGSLTYGNVVTSGNRLGTKSSPTRYTNRSFSGTLDASTSDALWGGIEMQVTAYDAGRNAKFRLLNGSTTQFYVSANSATNILVGGGSATEVDTGISSGRSTRLYLFNIDLSGAEPVAKLWISPFDFSSEVALGTPSVTITNIGAAYTAFSLSMSGGNHSYYDEIRIGTTLEDAWLTLPPVPPLATVIVVR